MVRAGVAVLVGFGLSVTAGQAQTGTPDRQSFEVVSIRQSKPETPLGFAVEHGRFNANLKLQGYIGFAYDLDLVFSRETMDAMLAHLPKWVSTDTFEVHAMAEGNPSKDQVRRMVQSMLADRFKLELHFVTTEASVLALTLEKPGATGPKLRPHSEGQPCDGHMPPQDSQTIAVGAFPSVCDAITAVGKPHGAILVASRDTTIKQIAGLLSAVGNLGRPVVDQTGLSGRFDFTLEFTPPQKVNPDELQPAMLEDAVREQLGLKLKPTRAPLDALVVDHVERPSEN
jgi:bla regulator protein blaR1